MKTMNKICTVFLAILLVSAGLCGASSAYSYTMEPWEEQFLAEYGEQWMYDYYGIYWFTYYLDENEEAYDPEYYDVLLSLYLERKAENDAAAVPTEPVIPVTPTPNETAVPTEPVIPVTPTPNETAVPTEPVIPVTPTPNETAVPTETQSSDDDSSIPVIPILLICIGVAVVVAGGVFVVRHKSPVVEKKEEPAEDKSTDAVSVPEEPKEEDLATPVQISEEPVIHKTEVEITVGATPRECYAKVAAHLSDKYAIPHISSLTPRQLLEFAEPTTELKEFVLLYEQIRYAPTVSSEQIQKLTELAVSILKQ